MGYDMNGMGVIVNSEGTCSSGGNATDGHVDVRGIIFLNCSNSDQPCSCHCRVKSSAERRAPQCYDLQLTCCFRLAVRWWRHASTFMTQLNGSCSCWNNWQEPPASWLKGEGCPPDAIAPGGAERCLFLSV